MRIHQLLSALFFVPALFALVQLASSPREAGFPGTEPAFGATSQIRVQGTLEAVRTADTPTPTVVPTATATVEGLHIR